MKEERRLFEKRMAEIAAKRKEIVGNQRNAAKLSDLLAQLKEVLQDSDDSSDEMDESTTSSSTVPSSNVEIEVKTENKGVGRDDERASKEMQVDQVERVEPLSTDSGGSVVGTHPVSAVADNAGVSDIGSSAVSGALL